MRFLYPLGLLGLLGIPVLIIIYIIKNKYTEQMVSSTYLWTLSERFLKRRNPINKLAGLISLILQILAVLFLSVSIAHPVFTLHNLAREYCFILDGSGSMNMVQNDTTRLERGKQEIASLINSSLNGSAYTLVYVGENTDVVFEGIEDKKRALTLLREVSPGYVTNGFNDAFVYAQEYFDRTPSVKTYLITDKDFEQSSNVNIVNVSRNEENYAVTGLSASVGADGTLTVSGKAISYAGDAVVHLGLYLDGAGSAVQSLELALKKLEPAEFSFECENTEFRSVRVAITEKDALALDSECVLFNEDYENSYRALIVSNTEAFFIRAALTSVGNIRIETVAAEDYKGALGYDLYIYDGFAPDEIPQDGAVWFFNPPGSVASTGFSVQSEVVTGREGKLDYSKSSASAVTALLQGLEKDEIIVSRYMKCGLYRNFTTLLSCQGNPVVFAGTNSYKNREVVFAFDLHDTTFTMFKDYSVLIANLVNYTFPKVIDEVFLYCGDQLTVNVVPNCESIRIVSPISNRPVYLPTDGTSSTFTLTEVGTYSITVRTGGGQERSYNVYSALGEAERYPVSQEGAFLVVGEASNAKRDGKFDSLVLWFILLAVLMAADWVVYCYDQYQLR